MIKEKLITIPNILSFYRLITFPLVLYFLFSGNEKYFAIFLCINLVTDSLDGNIARLFNMKTKMGARLDSLADIGMYISAFLGVYLLKMEEIGSHFFMFWIFLALYLICEIYSFAKFRKFPSLHLYSFKTTGYLQGIFFFLLFAWKFIAWYWYFALSFGFLACIEEILVIYYLPEMKSNVKGLYWILKNQKENVVN